MKFCKQGFTLIEFMIVVAIIGILAAVFAPVYQCMNNPMCERPKPIGLGVDVFVDPGTGCEYLIAGRSHGRTMAPRLDSQGRPICGGR